MVRNWKYFEKKADVGELYITQNQFMTGNLVGILMAPDPIKEYKGHLGWATTHSFPVRYKVIDSLYSQNPETIKEEITQKVRELELEGCRSIITSGGAFALYDSHLRNITDLPTLSSPLCVLEFAAMSLAPDKRILIYTQRSDEDENNYLKVLCFAEAIANRCIFINKTDGINQDYCKKNLVGAIIWDSPEGINISHLACMPVYCMANLALFIRNVVAQEPYEGNI